MTEQDTAFYRALFKLLANDEVNALLKKYATSQCEKHMRTVRVSKDMVDISRANGQLDAWNDIINLKETITKIVREL